MLRSFWSAESLLEGDLDDVATALNCLSRADLRHSAVFMHTVDERVARLDDCHRVLDDLLGAVDGKSRGAIRLDFEVLDAVLDGLADVNRDLRRPTRLLLAMVCIPPRWILEAPSDRTLQAMGRPYTFRSLWDRYVRFHAELHRKLVVRYALERPLSGLCALEIGNEPDYMWTPEEVKIEWGSDIVVNPLGKYITELQLEQVPTRDEHAPPFEKTPWGFREQDAGWSASGTETERGLLEFDWGPKFDWYIKCFAEFQAHVAWAVKDEASKRNVDMVTVSASVTHNNIDYLLRMHRSVADAFTWIDKIGLHPYHWPEADVWDCGFVGDEDYRGWHAATPRKFARSYFKRFDFLSAFRRGSGSSELDAAIRAAFGDRKLWITEFGIGSKILGDFNEPIAEYTRFIRPREAVGATAGYDDFVWEDLWGAFLDQVDSSWLRNHDVECLLLYALREIGMPGLDLNDDDRSNLALLRRDGSARIDRPILQRVGKLVGAMAESRLDVLDLEPLDVPVPAELYRRPWRSVTVPDRVADVLTMLSLEERALLYWLTSSYWSGAGAIVDGGCFVGGSTIAMAEGLRAANVKALIDVYDLFEVEPYMLDFYFKDSGMQSGETFRPIFDRNTAQHADLLRVHEGDLATHGWTGAPIEILFIDFAKSWQLNDVIVDAFFPSLIPGRSVVVQQDYVYAGCPWVALTMEHLSNYFAPVAFAEYCSVAYVCTKPIPRGLTPVSQISTERRIELMDHAVARFRGYPRSVVECAKATLLVEQGDLEAAKLVVEKIRAADSGHYSVQAALEFVDGYVESLRRSQPSG